MKRSVNLYTDDIKIVRQRITLLRLGMVASVLLVLMIASSWTVVVLTQSAADKVAAVQQQLDQRQQQIDALNAQLAAHKADATLLQTVDEKQQQLRDLREIYQRIKAPKASIQPAQLMAELRQTTPPQLWLTAFHYDTKHISLDGRAVAAKWLPFWMQRFAEYPLLGERNFSTVKLDTTDAGALVFRLDDGTDEVSDESLQ